MVVLPTPLIETIDGYTVATNQLELSKPTGRPEEADAVSGRDADGQTREAGKHPLPAGAHGGHAGLIHADLRRTPSTGQHAFHLHKWFRLTA